MTKRTASMKAKKVENKMTLEEMFNEAKQAFIITVETNVLTANRIDNLMNLRDMARKFWDDGIHDDVKYLKKLQKVSIKAYEDIIEVAKTFDLEEFKKPDMKDYFENIVPSVDDIESKQDMIEAAIIFLSVQPYGSKMNQIHTLVQDELGKMEFEAKSE